MCVAGTSNTESCVAAALKSSQQIHDFFQAPNMVTDARCHRGRHAQRNAPDGLRFNDIFPTLAA
jgi:hypothetical protein